MEDFVRQAESFGVSLTPAHLTLFESYLSELQAWNEHTNLTAIRQKNDIISKHFLDSLSVVSALPKNTTTLADIGSGAGFPGLPIAIVKPEINVTLIESIGKKTNFLKHIVSTLKLTNVHIIQGRAEEIAHDPKYREQFDVVTARAVATLSVLVEYALPLLKINGVCIAQKNAGVDELKNAENAIQSLGGNILSQQSIMLPQLPERQLIVIQKIIKTSSEYPRRSNVISRKPL